MYVRDSLTCSRCRTAFINLKMAAAHKFARFLQRTRLFNRNYCMSGNGRVRLFSTIIQQPKILNFMKFSIISAATGIGLGSAYAYYEIEKDKKNINLEGKVQETVLLKHKPPIAPSRKVFLPIIS